MKKIKNPDEKRWTFNTMLLNMVGKNLNQLNRICVLPNFCYRIEINGDDVVITMDINSDINPAKECTVGIIATDDTDSDHIMDAINLGYFRLYAVLKDAKLVKKTPLTYKGKRDGLESRLHLPMRI